MQEISLENAPDKLHRYLLLGIVFKQTVVLYAKVFTANVIQIQVYESLRAFLKTVWLRLDSASLILDFLEESDLHYITE